ncbi:hypothetical protein X943_000260 [Babesia divergens]|uniref:Uncharacterized protein n=1 Tax=Babesia divergens TaxID=32595 RepID=A0AAD9LJ72_BABDI|nr:hypothetical protein X943_000260 [Babesia divergens]
MFRCHVASLRNVVRIQRRNVLVKSAEERSTRDRLQVLKTPGNVSKYEFPRNPDSLLVEGARLSRGERLYQGFAVGKALLIYCCLSLSQGFPSSQPLLWPPLNVEKVLDTAPLPKLLTAKDLRKLIYVKRPTVVVYFRNAEGDEKANQLNLLFVLLKEISELYGSPLDVFRVNVNEEYQYFNKYLKESIKNSGDCLLHLVVPDVLESQVLTIVPPVSVKSFVSQLSKTLDGFNIKFSKGHSAQQELDEVLTRLKLCLFSLRLEGATKFIEGHSIQQLEVRCNQFLETFTKST